MRPGATLLTVMPSLPTARESDLAQMCVAPLGGTPPLMATGSSPPVRFTMRPKPARLHVADERMREFARRMEIKVHRVIPLFERAQAVERARTAGVVDEDVELPELVDDLLPDQLRRIPAGDIAHDDQRAL